MANKAYIVANEEQEREVLKKLYGRGYKWKQYQNGWLPQQDIFWIGDFPFCLFAKDNYLLKYGSIKDIRNHEIVYDGRKGSKMKISKEAYDALVEWKKRRHPINNAVNSFDLMELSRKDEEWWQGIDTTKTTNTSNWLITLIRWASGEDVFEVEKPKKWVVRIKLTDKENDYGYVEIPSYNVQSTVYSVELATKFDTEEEAESWANAHQKVVEVEL